MNNKNIQFCGLNFLEQSIFSGERYETRSMEVSAFAAYQAAAVNVQKNKSPKKKSRKDKKQEDENSRPEFILPKVPKAAKKVSAENDLELIFPK